jgi:hypothetical protein
LPHRSTGQLFATFAAKFVAHSIDSVTFRTFERFLRLPARWTKLSTFRDFGPAIHACHGLGFGDRSGNRGSLTLLIPFPSPCAISGIFFAPKNTRSSSRMISISGTPRFPIGANPPFHNNSRVNCNGPNIRNISLITISIDFVCYGRDERRLNQDGTIEH